MEEVIDFDEWYQKQVITVEYWAVYDPLSGQVKGVYPNRSADAYEHKIKIDNEVGEAIGAGRILLSNCFVDFEADTLEIIETKPLIKIDDVLHRIVDQQWSNIKDIDLLINVTYNKIVFSLSDKIKSKKRIRYNNDTVLDFYFTSYNDPHELYSIVSFQIQDLIDNDKVIDLHLSNKFSVYTKRIFKNYVISNENNRI